MTDELIREFLAGFDESEYPRGFLQRYELMECLSHNSIGETLLVKDRGTGAFCVAKCYTDPSLLSRTAENDLLKRLHHEGLPVYVGEYRDEKILCVLRSFAPGKSLDQLAQERPLTRQQAVAIAVQLCDILDYLHGQTPAIIHRDIKPQNVIVDEQGRVTLIDFGISRTYDEASREDTHCFGTRYYAAPEQYGFFQTDARSDIYSLGVLLGWMLTGSEDVQQAKKSIPNVWLAGIVAKCVAFSPQDRYKNVAQVKAGLTGRTIRRWLLGALYTAILLLAGVLFLTNSTGSRQPAGVSFQDPAVEEAVRLVLGKDEAAPLSEEDLLAVTGLFAFGDRAAANEADFEDYAGMFANNEGPVLRGSIHSLADLSRMKNLRKIRLAFQDIQDLSPLAGLASLEFIDLRHNPVQDVSPLADLTTLTSLFLFDTNVSDLTSLQGCFRLTTLDVGNTAVRSTAALAGLDSLQMLAIRRAPLRSLDQVETLLMLEEIDLSETQVLDLSPLLELPRLRLVKVSENMRPASEAIREAAQFSITYP